MTDTRWRCPRCHHLSPESADACEKCALTRGQLTTPTEAVVIQRVIIADVHMPFASMIGFMIKWSFAAIPAIFILAAAWFVGYAVLTAILIQAYR